MADILYKDKETFSKIIKEMRFSYLRISITSDCNAHCSFCHNEGQKLGLRDKAAQQQQTILSNQ